MTMTRKGSSHYIKTHGPQDAAITKGFQWLLSEAKKSNNLGIVAVSTKANLENISNWSGLRTVLDQLRQTGQAKVGDVTLNLVTLKGTIYSSDAPILAIYGGQELLDKVDGISGTSSVLYIPWGDESLANWVDTWRATELGQPQTSAAEQVEPTSGVVYFALESLTSSVNLSSGIGHPNDYERAVRTLETLFHKQPAVEPELIRQQLVRLGWNPKDAGKVKELAEKIWEGRRPKKSVGRADETLWNYWNSKSKLT